MNSTSVTADSSVPAEYTLSILMLTVVSMFSLAVVARVLLLNDCGTTAPPSGCAAAPKADPSEQATRGLSCCQAIAAMPAALGF